MAEAKKCSVANCKRPYRAKGYCSPHFKKWRAGEMEGHGRRYKVCKEENCRKPIHKKGMCEQHYGAWHASKKEGTAEAGKVAGQQVQQGAEVATPAAEAPAT